MNYELKELLKNPTKMTDEEFNNLEHKDKEQYLTNLRGENMYLKELLENLKLRKEIKYYLIDLK